MNLLKWKLASINFRQLLLHDHAATLTVLAELISVINLFQGTRSKRSAKVQKSSDATYSKTSGATRKIEASYGTLFPHLMASPSSTQSLYFTKSLRVCAFSITKFVHKAMLTQTSRISTITQCGSIQQGTMTDKIRTSAVLEYQDDRAQPRTWRDTKMWEMSPAL